MSGILFRKFVTFVSLTETFRKNNILFIYVSPIGYYFQDQLGKKGGIFETNVYLGRQVRLEVREYLLREALQGHVGRLPLASH